MLFLAQIPGAEEAIASATAEGWVAVLLVTLVLATFAGFGYMLKKIMAASDERETRLSTRVSMLEDTIRVELFQVLKQNSEAIGKMLAAADSIVRAADRMTATLERFTNILDVRPCLLPSSEQRRLLKEYEDSENRKNRGE